MFWEEKRQETEPLSCLVSSSLSSFPSYRLFDWGRAEQWPIWVSCLRRGTPHERPREVAWTPPRWSRDEKKIRRREEGYSVSLLPSSYPASLCLDLFRSVSLALSLSLCLSMSLSISVLFLSLSPLKAVDWRREARPFEATCPNTDPQYTT